MYGGDRNRQTHRVTRAYMWSFGCRDSDLLRQFRAAAALPTGGPDHQGKRRDDLFGNKYCRFRERSLRESAYPTYRAASRIC